MNCFSCFGSHKRRKSFNKKQHSTPSKEPNESKSPDTKKKKPGDECNKGNIAAQIFTFRELATATRNFRQEYLLGEGGFGRVYKGTLASNGQVVAVKQLDRNGMQGNKEFHVEVLMLSLLNHPNLVNLVGYCADGDQRLLVYEYMSEGSLEDHLLDIPQERMPLDWSARMKIAFGAAKGLEYLHDKANPPVIYRDLKPSNILLDENLTPKLSDFGLARLSLSGDSMHVSSRVMGTYGYCAPEYARGGQLTLKSDVYSFGVVLLELITGRRAVDTTKPMDEQNLVAWAQPIFRDPKRFPDMADPLLKNQFAEKDLNQAVAIAAMCLQEESAARPLMSDVVTALSFLSMSKAEFLSPSPSPPSTPPSEEKVVDHVQEKNESEDGSDNEDKHSSGSEQDEDSSDNENHQNQERMKGHDREISDYQDLRASSRYKDSKRLPEASVSPRSKNSNSIHDESDSSSNGSSRGSHGCNALLSLKSDKKSSRKSSSQLHDGDVCPSRKSSIDSHHETEYLSYKSSRRSQNGSSSFDNNSIKGSYDGSVHLELSNSRGSEDGSIHSS